MIRPALSGAGPERDPIRPPGQPAEAPEAAEDPCGAAANLKPTLPGGRFLTILNFFVGKPQIGKIPLELREILHIFRLAQIARACGRVSVGGDPDKRPVTRQ